MSVQPYFSVRKNNQIWGDKEKEASGLKFKDEVAQIEAAFLKTGKYFFQKVRLGKKN